MPCLSSDSCCTRMTYKRVGGIWHKQQDISFNWI
jgi:hypothetical protein